MICSNLAPPLLVINLMRGVWLLHADTLQPAVRFGGSFPVYDATVSNRPRHRPHVLVETDEHDHCALPVLYSWTALCEKNGRIQRLDTASLQLLTSVTWHQFSYDSATVMLPVSAPISLIPNTNHIHTSRVDRPAGERRPGHICHFRVQPTRLAPDCSWSIGLGL